MLDFEMGVGLVLRRAAALPCGNVVTTRFRDSTMQFEFRPLIRGDLDLLRDWLRRPHLRAVWPSPDSLQALEEEYLPADPDGAAKPFIAYLSGRPVGYIQYYVVAEGQGEWWPDDPPPGTVGIDQFLADADMLGRGCGSAMVRQFVNKLFDDRSVTQIRADPAPTNALAIGCYRKVGFRILQSFTSPDGPAVLMVLDRDAR